MKPSIILDANGGTYWIGGLYYKKNILFSLLSNEKICDKYRIIVATEPENTKIFEEFGDRIKIVKMRIQKNRPKQLALGLLAILNRTKYIYPGGSEHYMKFGITPIRWVPDFQHNHYPEFFTEYEIGARDETYNRFSKDCAPLVLSSVDCLNDFKHFYPSDKDNIYVVHFVSYIEKELRAITPEIEKAVLEKFNLVGKKYACVMNQFWQHKNHKVVFDALKLFYDKNPDSQFEFVFTGKLQDHRSPEYIEKLEKILRLPEITAHVNMLGFVERIEQLVVMKNAEFVVQPSLFEGWGTVVEDAKVLDKTILLSNISVHVEQKNDKCIIFDPFKPEELADLIEKETMLAHNSDIESGIADMKKRAYEYSKEFEKIVLK